MRELVGNSIVHFSRAEESPALFVQQTRWARKSDKSGDGVVFLHGGRWVVSLPLTVWQNGAGHHIAWRARRNS